jgi:hypothetical protein
VGQDAARKVGRFYPLFQHTQVHSDLNGSGSGFDIRLIFVHNVNVAHTGRDIFCE